ncbi:YafY family protein [Aneurinibacillus migulanus]|uniref:helix-turn-helix transcriptional regulator n=1 Tax=Aneurinibacillus migulanus TaxID=47500 RepID=UPI002E2104CB|nr:YafY family protein [Aneurinibacillus migulanus]
MRADRLLSILLLLQNQGKMTSRELAEKLEVSERTIFRDMESLSAAGIPIFAERGTNGGWALSEGYRTNLTGMKTEEIVSLLLANPSGPLHDLGLLHNFESAFQKLLTASPTMMRNSAEYARQRLHIDGAGWHESTEVSPYLSVIQEATWENRKLHINYQKDEEVTERIIHPFGLVAKRNTWYVVAQTGGNIRTYRISRVRSAHTLDETFERPIDFNLAAYWEESIERFKSNLPWYPTRLKVNEKLFPRLYRERYIKIRSIHPMENGWVEADIEFHTLDSACESILGFGALVKVIEPFELRVKVLTEAKSILSIYNHI